ncbi:MAG: flagellar hook-associated protein FlgL [Acidimicrobiales bacterium]
MSLRITDLGLANQRSSWIDASRSRLAAAEEQIASGRRITRPSDSPADSANLLRHQHRLQRVGQFARNNDNAKLWSGAADQALQEAANHLGRARTLAIQAGNDTLGPVENKALADDIRAIADGFVAIANTRVQGRAIFAGTASTADAYDEAGNYLGDDGVVQRTIDTNETIAVSSTGPEIFGSSNPIDPMNGSLFESLRALADAVEAGDTDTVRQGIAAVDQATARVGQAQGRVGAVQQQLDAAQSRHGGEMISTEAHVATLRDVDIAEAIIRLRSAEASYEATLSATARGLSRSLLDFIR